MFSFGDQKGAIGLWELFNNIKDLKIQSTVWLFTGKHRAKKPQTKTTNTVKNLNVAYMQARSIGGGGVYRKLNFGGVVPSLLGQVK